LAPPRSQSSVASAIVCPRDPGDANDRDVRISYRPGGSPRMTISAITGRQSSALPGTRIRGRTSWPMCLPVSGTEV
jgi:hypothetical protein